MKLTPAWMVMVLLGAMALIAGCSGGPGAKSEEDIKSFQSNDFSKAPPGTREKIEAAQKSGGSRPTTVPTR